MNNADDERIGQLERLYLERFDQFVRVARAITGDVEGARDAVQEAFARAVRARKDLRDGQSVDAWVARIVLNCAHELTRGRARSFSAESAEEALEPPDDAERRQVRRALGQLPERQRLALFLRYYAGFEYSQIAEALGIKVGTVSATLNAARANVARLFEEVGT